VRRSSVCRRNAWFMQWSMFESQTLHLLILRGEFLITTLHAWQKKKILAHIPQRRKFNSRSLSLEVRCDPIEPQNPTHINCFTSNVRRYYCILFRVSNISKNWLKNSRIFNLIFFYQIHQFYFPYQFLLIIWYQMECIFFSLFCAN
jgi:hypothetical protein